MSKLFFILLLTLDGNYFTEPPSLSEVRLLYQKAVTTEKYCKEMLGLLVTYNEKNNPLLSGYKAGATMLMAKHAISPFSKFSYFNNGRKMLERAISADEFNIELRFLRFTAQSGAPFFLGYRDCIEMDKKYLLQSLPQLRDSTLKTMIIDYLEQSNHLSHRKI